MSGVVCAIRGGPFSQSTIEKAIAVAKKHSLSVYFLYVVNLDFLGRAASTRTHTINQEMTQMGEFILLAAQNQAAAEDVVAYGFVRHGVVSEEITTLCHEINADYLVLGWPQQQRKEEENVFTHALLQAFVENVAERTGAIVVMPDADDS